MKKLPFILFLLIFSASTLLAQPIKPAPKPAPKPNPTKPSTNNGKPNFEGIQMCIDLPRTVQHIEDEEDGRIKGVASHRLWQPGQTLKVKFLEGDSYVQERIKKYAPEWSKYANINFQFVTSGPAEIRIAFQNSGSWSRIGTDGTLIDQDEASMNFGWFNRYTTEEEFRRTTLHEFGHALGLCHEHQHPKEGIPWNKTAVYQYYLITQGWSREQVDENVFARYETDYTQYTAYDTTSIMHYPIDDKLTLGGFHVGLNKELSASDKVFIRQLYPGRAIPTPTPTPTNPTKPTVTPTNDNNILAITVSDELGDGQYSEKVAIEINGVVKKYFLKQNEKNKEAHTFSLPGPGTYKYRIHAYTTLYYYENGQTKTYQLEGYGTGTLEVRSGKQYVLSADGLDDGDNEFRAFLQEKK